MEINCWRWVHGSGAQRRYLIRLRSGDSISSGSRDPKYMEQENFYGGGVDRMQEVEDKWKDIIG